MATCRRRSCGRPGKRWNGAGSERSACVRRRAAQACRTTHPIGISCTVRRCSRRSPSRASPRARRKAARPAAQRGAGRVPGAGRGVQGPAAPGARGGRRVVAGAWSFAPPARRPLRPYRPRRLRPQCVRCRAVRSARRLSAEFARAIGHARVAAQQAKCRARRGAGTLAVRLPDLKRGLAIA